MPRSKSQSTSEAMDRDSSTSPVASTSSATKRSSKGKASKKQRGKKSKKTEKSDHSPNSSSSASSSTKNPPLYMAEDSSQEEEYDDDDAFNLLPDTHQSPPNLLLLQQQQMRDEEDDDEDEDDDLKMDMMSSEEKKRKRKPGIIYLSSIPTGFNVTRTTEFFCQFGKVGRVFLQPDKNNTARERKYSLKFSEGWIEFYSKRVAKEVANNVNNTAVGGKKKNQASDIIWNIKYLPRFKWAHLTERLNYEKASHHQKLRHEITAAKKESDHFKRKLESSKRAKKSSTGGDPASTADSGKRYDFRMKATDEEIRRQKRKDSLEAVLASAAGSLEAMTTQSGSSSSSLEAAPSPSKKKRLKSGDKKASAAAAAGGSGELDRREFLASVFGGGK